MSSTPAEPDEQLRKDLRAERSVAERTDPAALAGGDSVILGDGMKGSQEQSGRKALRRPSVMR